MHLNKSLILLAIASLSLSGCIVSKKKYLEMESLKLRAEKQVRQLTQENAAMQKRVQTMIADYETIKSDMLATNAHKDQLIANLHKQMNTISSSAAEKNSNMEDKVYAYEYEKRQLQSKIEGYQKNIQALTAKNETTAQQLSQAQSSLANVQFSADKKGAEIERLNQQIKANGNTASKYQAQLDGLNTEIDALKKVSAEKDQTIKRLQNNVDLLKKELQ